MYYISLILVFKKIKKYFVFNLITFFGTDDKGTLYLDKNVGHFVRACELRCCHNNFQITVFLLSIKSSLRLCQCPNINGFLSVIYYNCIHSIYFCVLLNGWTVTILSDPNDIFIQGQGPSKLNHSKMIWFRIYLNKPNSKQLWDQVTFYFNRCV